MTDKYVPIFAIDIESTINIFTNQSLALVASNQDTDRLRYSDPEISIDITVEKHPNASGGHPDAPTWHSYVVDFDDPICRPIQKQYGLWRRILYFLLDAIPSWYSFQYGEKEEFGKATFFGRWEGGKWRPTRVTQVAKIVYEQGWRHEPCVWPNPKYLLAPLDMAAPKWWLHFPDEISRETELAVGGVHACGLPIVSDQPLDQQLRASPHGYDEAGRFIFYRYTQADFFRGEDYSPKAYYGYLDSNCAFTFASSYYGLWGFQQFMLRSAASVPEDSFRRCEFGSPPFDWDLQPAVREQLLFGLMERWAKTAPLPARMPLIPERDDEQHRYYRSSVLYEFPADPGVYFGHGRDGLDGAGWRGGGLSVFFYEHLGPNQLPRRLAQKRLARRAKKTD